MKSGLFGAAKRNMNPHQMLQSCGRLVTFSCRATNTAIGLVSIMVFFALLYFTLYCYFIGMSFKQLKQRSSTEFRIANQIVRLQVRVSFLRKGCGFSLLTFPVSMSSCGCAS